VSRQANGGPQPADVLVIFGITGDLARVMTFRSLYRLEKRGLLDCPIVGVAFDDWTTEHLVQRAHDSIVGAGEEIDHGVFERLVERLSYVHGDFTDDATYEQIAKAIESKTLPVFYLEVPPSLFGTVVGGLAKAGSDQRTRASSSRSPFGPRPRVGSRAERGRLHALLDESSSTHRPLLGKMSVEDILLPPLREHDPRAGLERQFRLVRADPPWERTSTSPIAALLRPGRAMRDVVQNHSCRS
jgi:glucose-6-phosphate 1-dehydrogenase